MFFKKFFLMMYIQKIIELLDFFWSEKKFLKLSSYPGVKGAVTSNPELLFFILKNSLQVPNIYLVDRAIRVMDGGFLKKSMRLIQHHQFEVIIGNSKLIKEFKYLFEKSLEKIGVNKKEFFIEYLDDNWKQVSIGAKGYGYEVQCNGVEIVQLTFFSSIAGCNFSVPPMEITYGIERIALILQQKDNIFDLMWNETITYGELFFEREKHIYQALKLKFFSLEKELEYLNILIKRKLAFAALCQINYIAFILDVLFIQKKISKMVVQQYAILLSKNASKVYETIKIL